MAEENAGTQQTSGQESPRTGSGAEPAPGTNGPAPAAAAPDYTVEVPQALAPQPTELQSSRELEELRSLSDRYKQQLQGWEQQSRRHQEENQRLSEQLRAYDAALRQAQQHTQQPAQTQNTNQRPGSFKEAMDRYLAGDDHALDAFNPGSQQGPAPEQVAQIVDTRLNSYLSYMGKQQAVTTAHPELTDRTHPLYREAYELYDTVAQDPLARVLYPEDPSMQVSIVSPDGTSQKPMDLRILNQAVLTVKARNGTLAESARRNGAGDSLTANGSPTHHNQNQIEAIELFDPTEQREWANQMQSRAWPNHWPREPRAIAKFLWDGLSAAERQKRLEVFRTRPGRR